VAIVGSTASGKSAVAMAVAEQLGDVELVSIDSMQVYRGMDIGTAKPTPSERRSVPHHLIDIVDATHDFTVAEFRRAYAHAIDTISRHHHRALLVGGTGLYHRVVIDDFELPGEWPDVRLELEAEPDTAELFRRLEQADPPAARKMEPTNRRRVVRALEVTLGSGQPFSSFGPGVDNYPPTDVVQIGLRWPRALLSARLTARVHEMIGANLIAEVEGLSRAGLSRTAAQALGYKEILEMLAGRIGEDEAIDMIITRTRQFAIRQERWFRRDPRVRWIDIEQDPVAEASPAVIDALTA
jgi:tRNA dimethylallyltransferase